MFTRKRFLFALALFFLFSAFVNAMGNGGGSGGGSDDDDDDDGTVYCTVDADCYNQMHLCDTFVCVTGACQYTPIDCSDSDECTLNERCDPNIGECIADMNPACAACDQCCAQNPIFEEQILVANRGDRTTSIIYAGSETLRETVFHEPNAEPLYVNAPGCCGYDIGVGESEFFMVGDRLNSKVRFIDARTLNEFASTSTDSGVFHMYYHQIPAQIWVVCDISKTLTVIDLDTFALIDQSVPIPADLVANYAPHDITVGADFAIVTLIGPADSSWLIKYSTDTLQEVDRLQVPGGAHIFYTGESSEMVYVACDQGTLLMLNPTTFTVVHSAAVPGAHGVWQQGNVVYVADITDEDGLGSLYAFDVSTNTFVALTGSPYDLPVRNPHNIVPTHARDKLFVGHTRDSKLTVCDLAGDGSVIEPCRIIPMEGSLYDTQPHQSTYADYEGHVIEPGFATPMGIARLRPLCDCQTSCYDGDVCTEDICHMVGMGNPQYECMNNVIPDCGMNPQCVHEVNITVHDHSELEITEFNGHFEICHTSSYQGPNSAVVIGFDPYDKCDLNKRGTCDNREAIHDTVPAYCASEALGDGYGCTLSSGDHALSMPGLAIDFLWSYNVSQPTFLFDEVAGTAHLQGVLHDPLNTDLVIRLDLWLSGLVPEGDIPMGAPNTPFAHNCYVAGGGLLDPATWRYFTSVQGSIVAMPGTAYEGLYISVTTIADPFQLGEGANAKNGHYGLEGRFVWTVQHQPLDHYITVNNPSMYSTVNVDLDTNCTAHIDYCELFGEPQEHPANGWVVTLNEQENEIIYCRNFTISDLVGCRAYGRPHDHLFNYTLDHYTYDTLYSGALYATTLLPFDCEHHAYGEACGEDIVFQTHYNIVIEMLSSGTISVNFERTDLSFDARWLRNVWLEDGDLKVVFETRVRHIEPTDQMPHTTNLMFSHVDPLTETGYPLHIVDDMVPCDNQDGFCVQTWCLVSEDAIINQIDDFSGFKKLVFAVKVNGETKIYVTINFYIEAYHYGTDTYVQSQVDAALQLYSDPYFNDPYSMGEGTYFIDCGKIYGILSFSHYFEDLEAVIRRAYICYSNEIELVPYDPHYPDVTGCNTQGGYIHKKLVYSYDPQEPVEGYFNFELLEDPSYEISAQRFCFEGHAVTPNGQLLQIEYHAVDPSLPTPKVYEGLIEMESKTLAAKVEPTYDDYDAWHDHYTPENTCDYEHALYAVHCERDKHYDYKLHRCVYDSYGDRDHYDDDGPGRPYGYHDDYEDDDDDNDYLAWFIIVAILLAALFLIAYIFNWFGLGTAVSAFVVGHKTNQQAVVQHNHYIDDRDVIVQGHGNTVTQQQYTSMQPRTGSLNQDGIQQRRNTNTYQQQEINNEEGDDFFIF